MALYHYRCCVLIQGLQKFIINISFYLKDSRVMPSLIWGLIIVYSEHLLSSLMYSWHFCYQHSKHDNMWLHRKLWVTLLANPIRSQIVSMCFLLYRTMCKRAKVVTARSDGYQGWLCTAAHLRRSAWALLGCTYLGMLEWCHSRCHCRCRSLWQRCPLLSSHTPARTWMSHSGLQWCHHQF